MESMLRLDLSRCTLLYTDLYDGHAVAYLGDAWGQVIVVQGFSPSGALREICKVVRKAPAVDGFGHISHVLPDGTVTEVYPGDWHVPRGDVNKKATEYLALHLGYSPVDEVWYKWEETHETPNSAGDAKNTGSPAEAESSEEDTGF